MPDIQLTISKLTGSYIARVRFKAEEHDKIMNILEECNAVFLIFPCSAEILVDSQLDYDEFVDNFNRIYASHNGGI